MIMYLIIRSLLIYLLLITFSNNCCGQSTPFDYELLNDKGKVCLTDHKGRRLTDFIFDNIEYIGDGYYLVELKNRFGIIDYKGKTIIPISQHEKLFYKNDSIQFRLNRDNADSATYKVRYDHTWRALFASYGRAFYIAKRPALNVPSDLLQQRINTIDFFALAFKGPSNHINNYGLELKYYLPFSPSGSISDKLWGFQISNYWGANLVYIKDFDVPLSFGFHYGCLYYKTDSKKFYNPASLMSLNVSPRFIYRRLILSASLEAQWDISKGKWKSRTETTQVKMKSHQLNVGAGIAYMLFDYKSSYQRIYW